MFPQTSNGQKPVDMFLVLATHLQWITVESDGGVMLLCFTINGAKQLGIEDRKGSITAGKDADYLVFDKDLLTAEKEGFSYNKPTDVYFAGKKVN